MRWNIVPVNGFTLRTVAVWEAMRIKWKYGHKFKFREVYHKFMVDLLRAKQNNPKIAWRAP